MKILEDILHRRYESFFLIAGPCVVEDEKLLMTVAEQVAKSCADLGIPYIFKSSYRKANRTKGDSFQGIGDEKALRLLEKVKRTFDLPVLTDIHSAAEAAMAAEFVDVLQIPAFLCRQTDLLVAAAETGKIVNVKKGQFLSADSMRFAVEKIQSVTNSNACWLTERGNIFGYHDLVVDFCNIPQMQSFNVPVIMDCTHSLQKPNQHSGVTGGQPTMIATIAKAAIASGVDGIFIETHPEPSKAKSDGANMLALEKIGPLLEQLKRIHQAAQ